MGLDGVVLAFTLGLSVFVGLLSEPSRPSSGPAAVCFAHSSRGVRRPPGGFGLLRDNRARAVLAAAQVALALVLLVGAGLLLRSFVGLVTLDRGYDPADVVAADARFPFAIGRFEPRETFIEYEASKRRFYGELAEAMDRLSRLPDVEAAGVSSRLPLAAAGSLIRQVQVAGGPAAGDRRELPEALLRVASPG